MRLSLAQAYLEQAKADFSTYNIIKKTSSQPCSQWLHLLQMTLEKTAKAYLAAANQGDFDTLRQSHRAFGRFMRLIQRNNAIRQSLHIYSISALRAHINGLLPLVDAIERIIPAKDNKGPTAEYPWENPQGGFYSPCYHDFLDTTYEFDNTPHADHLMSILNQALTNDIWHKSFSIK